MSRVSIYISKEMYWEDFSGQRFMPYGDTKTDRENAAYNAGLRWGKIQEDVPRFMGIRRYRSHLYAAILGNELREAGLLRDF